MAAGQVHPVGPSAGASAVPSGEPSPLGVLGETAPRSRTLGLYVHVPFCVQRCHYCSFNTAPLDADAMGRYLAALHREVDLLGTLPWAERVTLVSVFLGGGTPSLLPAEDLGAILARCAERFAVAGDAEITVECNPESVTRPKLEGYRAAGVNRLSLGVQSLDAALLPRLGRLHTPAGARAAFEAGREAGFGNMSVDLMYGLPGLDLREWARTVEAVLDWAPEHLSAYGLTLDGGSRWGTAGVEGLPAEETIVEQYWSLVRAAGAHGYEHYEISNYARPGCRSRHNLTYWRAAEYLAAGPGGCGFIGDVRYGNVKPLARYTGLLSTGVLPLDSFERLTDRQQRGERLILGLRTADGVPAGWLAERAADDARLASHLSTWEADGLLVEADGRARLTERGFLLSDALFVELL